MATRSQSKKAAASTTEPALSARVDAVARQILAKGSRRTTGDDRTVVQKLFDDTVLACVAQKTVLMAAKDGDDRLKGLGRFAEDLVGNVSDLL